MNRAALGWILLAGTLLPSSLRAGDDPGEKAGERKPIDEVIKGEITAFDGSRIEVKYDFKTEIQLEDFNPFKPFTLDGPFERKWWDHSLHLKGTGGVVWKVVCRRGVELEYEGRYAKALDVGGYIAEERISDEFTMFSIYDQFFQNKDRRGSPKQHMIARFTMHAPDAGGDRAFRYVIRKGTPPVLPGRTVKVKFGRSGTDDWMEIDGEKMAGGEPQWPLLRGYRPGLYVLDNEAWIGAVVLRGDVDPDWAKANGVDLTLTPLSLRAKPAPVVKEPTAADRAAMDRIAKVRSGEGAAGGLLGVIEDATLLESVREDAGKAMEESGDAKLVPRLVPVLEGADPVARKVAGRAVDRLCGKSFGFPPDGSEEKRRKAIRAILDFIEKNPAKFR